MSQSNHRDGKEFNAAKEVCIGCGKECLSDSVGGRCWTCFLNEFRKAHAELDKTLASLGKDVRKFRV
jgi:hypothetical protein